MFSTQLEINICAIKSSLQWGFFMFISIGGFLIIGVLYWFLWSKLCDIEKKLFRLHDEVSLSLQDIEKQIDILQDIAYRIESNTNREVN